MTVFLKNLNISQFKCKNSDKKTANADISRPKAISFPIKLHQMLAEVEREGKQSIVSWNPDGRTFQVHNLEVFVKEVLPRYFHQTKYKSFQRQLNFYAFQRIVSGPLEGAYGHPSFVKEKEELCNDIKRIHQSRQQKSRQKIQEAISQASCAELKDTPYQRRSVDGDSDDHDFDLGDINDLSVEFRLVRLLEEDNTDSPRIVDCVVSDGATHGRESAAFSIDDRFSFVGKRFFAIPTEWTEI